MKCPDTGSELKYDETNQYFTNKNGKVFQIRNNVVDFVELDDYSESFGMQWNIFNKTQLDSYTGHKITHDRFGMQHHGVQKKLKVNGF